MASSSGSPTSEVLHFISLESAPETPGTTHCIVESGLTYVAGDLLALLQKNNNSNYYLGSTSNESKQAEHQLRRGKEAAGAIHIDGEMDEQAWKEADAADNFFMVLPMDTSHAKVNAGSHTLLFLLSQG